MIKENDLQRIYNKIYPIGSYYFSNNSKDPGEIFGGSWTPINNYFLYSVKSMNNSINGGKTTAVLPNNMIAPHTHSYSHSHSGYSHTHRSSQNSHSHTVSAHSHTGSTSAHQHKPLYKGKWPGVYTPMTQQIGGTSPVPIYYEFSDIAINTNMTWPTSGGYTEINSASTNLGTVGYGGSTMSGSGGSGPSGSSDVTIYSAGSNQSFSIMPSYKGYYAWYRYA